MFIPLTAFLPQALLLRLVYLTVRRACVAAGKR